MPIQHISTETRTYFLRVTEQDYGGVSVVSNEDHIAGPADTRFDYFDVMFMIPFGVNRIYVVVNENAYGGVKYENNTNVIFTNEASAHLECVRRVNADRSADTIVVDLDIPGVE